jgi:hypothetical protein
MGHQGGRGVTREGSAVGARYRHTTDDTHARVLDAIEERLRVALGFVPACAPGVPQE